MTSPPARSDLDARLVALLSRLVAVILASAIVLIVLLAPADAATPSSNPGGTAIAAQQHRDDVALGDQAPTEEHGISWAARTPSRASVAFTLVISAIIVALATTASCRRRPPARLVAAHQSLFSSTSVCRGPPATSLARP
jgi:hypothetical protein